MSNSDELPYWVGLNLVRGIGPAKFRALLDYFGSAQNAWQAELSELSQVGLDRRTLDSFVQTRSNLNPQQDVEKTLLDNISIHTWDDDDYPRYLKEIPDPPPVLYVKGDLQTRDEWSVAVVGTRRATSYGKHVTRQLVQELVRNGATIVSGLARGIDSIAHQAALDAGGRTLAVLGSGIRKIYPPEHRRLAERVAESGAIISDFSPDTPPEAGNFPRRNRIISGLSLGVLVIEAGNKSGALITANYALDQGRDVFAVPGNISSRMSYGTNRLIQQGAKMVISASDILEELNMTMVAEQVATQLSLPASHEEAQLLKLLSDAPCHVDELSRHAAMPVSMVTSTLTMMELKGMVRQVESMSFVRIREPKEDYKY
ncbi:MAG: DNA-processing protein DprA [Anaerolineales bacterium]|nr:DNA-processing protein DprA [Anaerolineales bacterium]